MVAAVVYRSNDAGAPVLNGTSGKIIDVLDACLVNGYGAKPAAGWTKPFSAANKAAYRMGTGGTAVRMYLRVDNTVHASNFYRFKGMVTMSDIDTGTEPFPKPNTNAGAYSTHGLYGCTSQTADATLRHWVVIATPVAFYMFTFGGGSYWGDGTPNSYSSMFFGEYTFRGAGFTHNVALIGGDQFASSSGQMGKVGVTVGPYNSSSHIGDDTGHFCARNALELPGSVMPFGLMDGADNTSTSNQSAISTLHLGAYPNPVTGKLELERPKMVSWVPGWSRFGYLPGLWAPQAYMPNWSTGDMFVGSGELAGHTLLLMRAVAFRSVGYVAVFVLDITDMS